MYRSILVPVDGSALSEYAIPIAVEIAGRTGGEVRLLRVAHRPSGEDDQSACVASPDMDRLNQETRRLASTFANSRVDVKAGVRVGSAPEEILQAAEWSDLVVLSTHGQGGIARWVLGSTADKVIRLACRPVLAVRPPDPPSRELAEAAAAKIYRDIEVALDGSDLAEKSLDDLRALVPGDTRLHFVRVVPREPQPAAVHEAETYLRNIGASFLDRGVKVSASVEKSDCAAEAIAAYALREGCGLIALGTHGRSGLTRWILGSVTDKVVRHGPVPVLVIRRGRPPGYEGKRRQGFQATTPARPTV